MPAESTTIAKRSSKTFAPAATLAPMSNDCFQSVRICCYCAAPFTAACSAEAAGDMVEIAMEVRQL